MSKEFKKINKGSETHYVLETMTAGATGAGSIATAEKDLGEVQRRNPEPPKPRNFVAKNAKMGGAGQHKDKKKASKQGDVKHKNKQMDVAEGFNGEYDDEAGMARSNLLTSARAVMGLLKTIKDRDNLPEWGQEKIAKAEMMLVSVWDYLQSQKEQGIDPQQDMEEGLGRMRGSSSAYDRDYASSVSGMGRGPDHRGLGQELAHETNNYAVAIDGKTWKVFADQRQAENIARSLKAKGKNATVHPTGANPSESVAEVAPPGWEKTVKAMKKHDEIDNPFALAWSMKNKGYKSHKKENAVGEATPTGNEADVRRKLIKYIARWKDWDISDLELAKTDELIDMYKECQKEKKDWLNRRSDWWSKSDELAKQKGISKLDALKQVPHDLDRDDAQGQLDFREDVYTSELFNQLEERTKK